jgi:tricarballylate dehydrogenase
MANETVDVLVAGSGNAAMAAAVAAHEAGARVLVLEKAPYSHRGGNSRFSSGATMRHAHNGIEDLKEYVHTLQTLPASEVATYNIPPYPKDTFYRDLMRVTRGLANPDLAALLINESQPTLRWMVGLGHELELLYDGTVLVEGQRKWPATGLAAHPKDGGAGLIDCWLRIAQQKGIEVRLETRFTRLLVTGHNAVCGAEILGAHGRQEISSKAVVLACGGFEANPKARAAYLGSNWDVAKVRGTRYNTGEGLEMALAIGAQPDGHWSSLHCSTIDASAPQMESKYLQFENRGTNTNRKGWVLGITVNTLGQRFFDEGEDFANYTYAKTGPMILQQPDGIVYQIYDAKLASELLSKEYEYQTWVVADTIEELAQKLEIHPEALAKTVREFNAAVVEDRTIDRTICDGRHTLGVWPPKSNWAQKIDTPPYRASAVTAGITFTYGGLKVNPRMQVFDVQERPIPGLYAAGEMTGGFFYYNYPSGSGIPRGFVTGRIAGRSAATDSS